jgi:hypothetical protein
LSAIDRLRDGSWMDGDRRSEGGIGLRELLDRYDLVDVQPTHIVVTEKMPLTASEAPGIQLATANRPTSVKSTGDQTPDLRELGTTGWTAYGQRRVEYLPEIRGIQGLRLYDQMRRGDARVRSTLRLVKTPVLSGRWYIEPASQSTRDQNVADFVWKNLTVWLTNLSWEELLTEALLMLDFGYYMFEKVFTTDDQGRVIWKKFAPRHPMDVYNWEFDKNGGPDRVVMSNPDNYGRPIEIPIRKLLVFSFDKEAGNLEGISILRSAYKHWFYQDNLYKIDAIQKERHGIGIPVVKLPPGFNSTDKALADEMGRNIRANEKAHVILPPGWELDFADLKGHPVDALASAQHHGQMIRANILADFIANSTTGGDAQDLFIKATRFVADIIKGVFNKYAIPQLVDYNWTRVGYPQLRVRRIGEATDWRILSFSLRNMAGAGILQPDDKLEDWLREEMDLPARDSSTTRIIDARFLLQGLPAGDAEESGVTGPAPDVMPADRLPSGALNPILPPGPAPVGPPRQSPGTPKGMRNQAGLPGSQAGTDKSGG